MYSCNLQNTQRLFYFSFLHNDVQDYFLISPYFIGLSINFNCNIIFLLECENILMTLNTYSNHIFVHHLFTIDLFSCSYTNICCNRPFFSSSHAAKVAFCFSITSSNDKKQSAIFCCSARQGTEINIFKKSLECILY